MTQQRPDWLVFATNYQINLGYEYNLFLTGLLSTFPIISRISKFSVCCLNAILWLSLKWNHWFYEKLLPYLIIVGFMGGHIMTVNLDLLDSHKCSNCKHCHMGHCSSSHLTIETQSKFCYCYRQIMLITQTKFIPSFRFTSFMRR